MSILRIPFSLSLAWAATTVATAPQPPPRSEERVSYDISSFEISARLFAVKTCFWTAALGEVALILASNYPSTTWSKRAAAFLIASHPASSNIRITWTFLVAWFFSISGALLRRHCYQTLGEMHTFELSLRSQHKLITSGPYAVIRHPSYTGCTLAMFGASICYSTPGSWVFEYCFHSMWAQLVLALCWFLVAVTAIFFDKRVAQEDKMLRERFGTEWETWAKKVPGRVIPWVY